jgi:enoyl-CoA hydratase/carnithine racemase
MARVASADATQNQKGPTMKNFRSEPTLTQRLDHINELMLSGEATDEQEAEGLKLVYLADAAPRFLESAKLVLERWERGDLAGAVRQLAAAIDEAAAP